jgi:hypothetical protein
LCDAGYLCVSGSTTPRPIGSNTDKTACTVADPDGACSDNGVSVSVDDAGGICPSGGYCEIGAKQQSTCKGGYYNPETGAKTVYNCQKCYPGFYCAGEASASMSGKCTAGYYCIQSDTEGGSSVPD